MCLGRFLDYGVHPEALGRAAELRGYALCFNKHSGKDKSGKGNVEERPGETTWGVLFMIPDRELPILDVGEGRGYKRVRLRVESAAGPVDAWVYVAKKPSDDATLRPFAWYKRFIVEGARSHGLPQEYVAKLEKIDAIDDSNQARDRERRALNCD